MTREPQRRVVLATLVVLALVGLATAVVPPVAADSHENGTDAYVIEQGDRCIDVDPVVNESQSAEAFYDYRHPDTDPSASTYSSYGTTAYQADNESTLVLYRGSEGTSLVIVHERLHDPASQGTNGSSATFTITGLSPDDDGWVVEDDDYGSQDDVFEHSGTVSEIDWVWARGRTDGGVYRGLDGDVEIEIDPAFNEAADQRYTSPGYDGQVHDWSVVSATDDGHERTGLDSLSANVTIASGYCAAPPNATLAVDDPDPAVNETTVTLDASGSTAPAGVAEYRWDLTGDGTVDRITTDPVLEHTFTSLGARTVTATIVATDGQTATNGTTVTVGDDLAPTARLDAPTDATVGQTISLSAARSTDNHEIASYGWTIGNETVADGGPAVERAFDAPGNYQVAVTVTDPAGNENRTTATVSVAADVGPAASLDAPTEATVGESITLDASGSAAGANASYEWTVDGQVVDETTNSTYPLAFDAADSHEVGVTVTDENGTDAATATIDVAQPLDAGATASTTNATVGESITFDATGSTGPIAAHDWAFDDGTTIVNGSATVEHAFEAPGTYAVELTVRDAVGASDTATTAVTVVANETGPTARLDTPPNATVDEPVTLDASGSTARENATYVWVVDGASVGTTANATYDHAFGEAGDRAVTVTVTDETGSDRATTTVSVGTPDDGEGGNDSSDGGDDGDSGGGDTGGGSSDGDGGGGGGGGGYPPPSTEPEEPTETSVAIADGALVVTAEHVNAGEPVAVAVPANASLSANGSVGSDRGVVRLRSIEVTPAEDAEEARIAVAPAERPVPGRFAAVSAYEPTASIPLESVTYAVGADRSAMTAAGVSADDLTAYAREAAWDPRETAVETDAERAVATATVEGTAPVGLGAVGPVLYVRDVATTGVAANGSVPLATTVANTGTDPGEWTLPIEIGGETVAEHAVALDAGEARTLTSSVPASEAAEAGVTVASLRRELAVASVTALTASPPGPAPNESARIEAAVSNRGDVAGTVAVALRRDGAVVATETVALESGESTTVAFEQRFASEGPYALAAGNATIDVRVAERDSFDGEGSSVASDASPGFGALAAFAAAIAALLLARRR